MQTQSHNGFLTRTWTQCYFQSMMGDLGNGKNEMLLSHGYLLEQSAQICQSQTLAESSWQHQMVFILVLLHDLEATIYLHYITRLTGSKVLRWFFLCALMQVLSKWNDWLCKNINKLFQIFAEAFCISLPDQVTLTDYDKMSEVALRLRVEQKLTDRVRNWGMSCENCIEDFTHSHCMEGKDQWKKIQ